MSVNASPKTPTKILEARGSWRANARANHEPQYDVAIPKPPEWVDKGAHNFFKKLARRMAEAGVMTNADWVALGMLANAWYLYITAHKDVQEFGMMITVEHTDSKGNTFLKRSINPAMDLMDRQFPHVLKLCAHFGLTPASRADIMVGSAGKRNGNQKNPTGGASPGATIDDDERFFKTGT